MSTAMSSSPKLVSSKDDAGLNSGNVRSPRHNVRGEDTPSQTLQTSYTIIEPSPSQAQANPETGVASGTTHLHVSRDTKLRSRGQTASPHYNQPVLVREYLGDTTNMKKPPFARTRQTRSYSTQKVSKNPPQTSVFSFEDIFAAIQPEVQSSIDAIAEACGRNKLSLANEYDSHLPPHGALDSPPVLGEHNNSLNTPTISRLEPVEESSSIAEGSATANSGGDQVDRDAYRKHSRSWLLLAASNPGREYDARAANDAQTMARKGTPTAHVTCLDLRPFLEQTFLEAHTISAANPQPDSHVRTCPNVVKDDHLRNTNWRSSAASTLNKVLGNTSPTADA